MSDTAPPPSPTRGLGALVRSAPAPAEEAQEKPRGRSKVPSGFIALLLAMAAGAPK